MVAIELPVSFNLDFAQNAPFHLNTSYIESMMPRVEGAETPVDGSLVFKFSSGAEGVLILCNVSALHGWCAANLCLHCLQVLWSLLASYIEPLRRGFTKCIVATANGWLFICHSFVS